MSKCDYCRGVGACPKCWGRANITELQAQLAEAVALLREVCEDLDWKNELYPGGTAHAKLRAFLKEVDNG